MRRTANAVNKISSLRRHAMQRHNNEKNMISYVYKGLNYRGF